MMMMRSGRRNVNTGQADECRDWEEEERSLIIDLKRHARDWVSPWSPRDAAEHAYQVPMRSELHFY